MPRTMTATEARVHFGEVIRRVTEDGEQIIVERGGTPVVVVISVQDYHRYRATCPEDEGWRDLMKRTHEQILAELGDRELTPADEVLRQVREERDAQLSHLR